MLGRWLQASKATAQYSNLGGVGKRRVPCTVISAFDFRNVFAHKCTLYVKTDVNFIDLVFLTFGLLMAFHNNCVFHSCIVNRTLHTAKKKKKL